MSVSVSPAEAAQELLRRKKARSSLEEYIEYVSGKTPARHMRFLCRKLEKAAETPDSRTLICEPPGAAKSFVASWHFPARYLSLHPNDNIITASHTDAFAEQWGRRVRNLMLSDEHQALYPGITISEDSRAAGRWDTNMGGSYFATGVGGAVTGRRGSLIVIDDPLRGIEDADSETVRENMWSWWAADLSTRLTPGGKIILIQTRWHLDDLAGRLIASESNGGDKWEKIILPAFAKENDPLGRKVGEVLWPEWQNAAALERIKRQPSMTPRIWESLYQQSPIVEGGNIVKSSWFQPWRESSPPSCEFIIQSWDTAISNSDKAAWSACVTLGVFKDARGIPSVVLLSRWRGRVEYPELRAMAKRLHHNYLDDRLDMPMNSPSRLSPDLLLIEDKATGKPLVADFARAGIGAQAFPVQRYGDKATRLRLCLDIFENGRFYVPYTPPHFTMPRKFAQEYISSMTSYPATTALDECDATSQAIIRLKSSGWVNNADEQPPPPPWRDTTTREALYG